MKICIAKRHFLQPRVQLQLLTFLLISLGLLLGCTPEPTLEKQKLEWLWQRQQAEECLTRLILHSDIQDWETVSSLFHNTVQWKSTNSSTSPSVSQTPIESLMHWKRLWTQDERRLWIDGTPLVSVQGHRAKVWIRFLVGTDSSMTDKSNRGTPSDGSTSDGNTGDLATVDGNRTQEKSNDGNFEDGNKVDGSKRMGATSMLEKANLRTVSFQFGLIRTAGPTWKVSEVREINLQ